MPRSVIALGPIAVRKTVEILATAEIGRARSRSLEPGAQWGGDRLLLSLGGGCVQFIVGDTLYQEDLEGFETAEFPAGGAPPRLPSWLAGLSPHDMPFCMGMAGELALVWPGIVSGCAFLERFSHFYRSHRTQIELAARELRHVAEGLLAIQHWPALFELVMDSMGAEASECLPKAIGSADLGAFLGRLLIGAQHRRITLARVPVCLRTIRQSPMPQAQECLRIPQYRRMLEKLERGAESAAPVMEHLCAAL